MECYFAFPPTTAPPSPWEPTARGTVTANLEQILPATATDPAAPALVIAGITPTRDILILNLHGLAHLGLHGPNRRPMARSMIYQLLLTPTTTLSAVDPALIPAPSPRARVHDPATGPLPGTTITFTQGPTTTTPGTVTVNVDPSRELDNTLFTPANRSAELFCGPWRFEVWRVLDIPDDMWAALNEAIDPTPEPQPVDEILPDHLWVRVLGPIEIRHPNNPEATLTATTGKGTPNRSTELLTSLALAPAGQITAAEAIGILWPGATEDSKHKRYLLEHSNRLRRQFDEIPGSLERILLTREPGSRETSIRINPAITCDLEIARRLIPTTIPAAPTENLQAAVDLIRGTPFQDAPDGRWEWAKYHQDEAIDLLADAALELARRLLADGDTAGAYASCRAGLATNPQRQDIWQLALSICPSSDIAGLVAELQRAIPASELQRSTKNQIERASAA